MKEKVIDYLTLRQLSAEGLNPHSNQKIKSAYILAKIEYENMSEAQKEEIIEIIKKNDE